MNLTSKIILLQLQEEYDDWSDSHGFDEIGAETILSFWSDELPTRDLRFLTRFISRWNRAVETLLQEQVCAECRRFTPEALFVEWKNRLVCQSCCATLKKRWANSFFDTPDAKPSMAKEKPCQPTLF